MIRFENIEKFMSVPHDEMPVTSPWELADICDKLTWVVNRMSCQMHRFQPRPEVSDELLDAWCALDNARTVFRAAHAAGLVAELAQHFDGPQYQDWYVPGVSA